MKQNYKKEFFVIQYSFLISFLPDIRAVLNKVLTKIPLKKNEPVLATS
jgi:hypothetical protein